MPSTASPSLGPTACIFLGLRRLADRRAAARTLAQGEYPQPPHLLLGERGEDLAYFHLRSAGYTIVARRWHSPRLRGDLDLVAWDGDTLVVVEVKTRSTRDFAPAAAAVDEQKQKTLRQLAAAYRSRFPAPWRDEVPLRFDLLSVYDLPAGPEFEHLHGVFGLHRRPA